ncbi:tRNA (adenosine(37)-N6)-dimethylallyltransferase MiaA [Parapedobacter indicus]|uniref:tRNA dimethylallyltransferase n=1 Tax=Parapedobacter indicus TaxID=1477437 RepID=A0A1I3KVH9_9SPHI|nr:tRNA (adenosine(37)-N6)-dimethylallyltransferase MiaA [Parapedobacter indicus]PPL01937.1 tRNA dimethylallyltransferase [Parapedobacter indicus]SFI76541.1 tRNA dimethylallyltransferase [Parapedobacter indicus]
MSLLVILGPTASGKTKLAIEVAKRINGAIISADSRQVYRGMDIGTGKDLDVYDDVPHFLIDILDAGEAYHVAQYHADFHRVMLTLQKQQKQPILCGGTGLYIQSILQPFEYSIVPVDPALRHALNLLTMDALLQTLHNLPLPPGFHADTRTRKRLIRAIEIATWCLHHSLPAKPYPPVSAQLFGISPPVELRRQRITERLQQRLENGLLAEVQMLLDRGIAPEKLLYYGLEYKYATQYLCGEFNYDIFFTRLNTEIHRFAKRQMTYFRKMEKDGLTIHWLPLGTVEEMADEVIRSFKE